MRLDRPSPGAEAREEEEEPVRHAGGACHREAQNFERKRKHGSVQATPPTCLQGAPGPRGPHAS